MKLYALNIVKCTSDEESKPIILSRSTDLSSFGYFQASSVGEFITFISRFLAQRTEPNSRQQVEKEQYFCYCHSRATGICGILITDAEYPVRVAFHVVYKALMDFEKSFPSSKWQDDSELSDDCLHFDQLDALLKKYQDPSEADDLLKIKKDLDETKTVMNQALENVLHKGEKMNELVGKSEDLSIYTKAFYDNAASNNSCCTVM